MPPEVRKAGEVSAPVIPQAPVQIDEPKTKQLDTKDQKPEPTKQDAQTAAKNAEAAKQHAAGRKQQNVADEQIVRNQLDQKVPDKKTDNAVNHSHPQGLEETTRKKQLEIERKMEEIEKTKGQKQVPAKVGTAYTASEFAADAAKSGITAEPSAEAQKALKLREREMELDKKGAEISVELQRLSSGKPSFEESERLIQKIDAYKRELGAGDHSRLNSLYAQQTEKPTRMATRGSGPYKYEEKLPSELQDKPVNHMKNLLGAYGYDQKLGGGNPNIHEGSITQHQILETALHNWRATPPEERRMLQNFDGPPAKLPKGWKTPHDMREANRKAVDEQITAKEVYGKLHYDSPQKHQPNPDDRIADLKREVTHTGWTVMATGPSHGTPRPNLGSTPTISPNRTASLPEPVSVAGTQPGRARSTPPSPPSKPVNPGGGQQTATLTQPGRPQEGWQDVNVADKQGKPTTGPTQSKADKPGNTSSGAKDSHVNEKNQAESTKPGESKGANVSKTNRMSRPADEIKRDLAEAEAELERARKAAEAHVNEMLGRERSRRVPLGEEDGLNQILRDLASLPDADPLAGMLLGELSLAQRRVRNLRRETPTRDLKDDPEYLP